MSDYREQPLHVEAQRVLVDPQSDICSTMSAAVAIFFVETGDLESAEALASIWRDVEGRDESGVERAR